MNVNMQTFRQFEQLPPMRNWQMGYDLSQQVMASPFPTYNQCYEPYFDNEAQKCYSESTSQGSFCNQR